MKIYANPKTLKPQHFASLKARFSAHEWIGDFDLAMEAEVSDPQSIVCRTGEFGPDAETTMDSFVDVGIQHHRFGRFGTSASP
ncbi:MAG: hypothetical protein MZU97_17300 [Bacillus subtilis]|nr:hypothetical protein [Bacillus subtilis]